MHNFGTALPETEYDESTRERNYRAADRLFGGSLQAVTLAGHVLLIADEFETEKHATAGYAILVAIMSARNKSDAHFRTHYIIMYRVIRRILDDPFLRAEAQAIIEKRIAEGEAKKSAIVHATKVALDNCSRNLDDLLDWSEGADADTCLSNQFGYCGVEADSRVGHA